MGTDADPRPQVVREVVERERVVIRRAPVTVWPIPGGTPTRTAPPTRAREWVALLAELERQLTMANHDMARNHWDHARLYRALVNVMAALGRAHPGGLERFAR